MAAAGAVGGPITSRDFTGNRPKDMILLSFLERKHDFGGSGKELPLYADAEVPPGRGKPRNAAEYDYFSKMYTTIFRHSLRLDASYSLYFSDACKGPYSYGPPEDLGLGEANKKYRGGAAAKHIERNGDAPDAFYMTLAEELNDFRVGTKIPIVIDFGWCLKLDAGRIDALGRNFIIVKNKESYSDPGKKSRQNFGMKGGREGTYTARVDADEVDGQPLRTYMDNVDLYTGLGNVVVAGTIADTTISYGVSATGPTWTETFNTSSAHTPNEIGICKIVIKKLVNEVPKVLTAERDICNTDGLNGITATAPYARIAEIQKIGIQYTKKKCADNLSAASCKKAIRYMPFTKDGIPADKTILYGGAATPCVFWTHDRLAAAFAIMHHIPTVLEHIGPAKRVGGSAAGGGPSGSSYSVDVYLPTAISGGAQSGGMCTREILQQIVGDIGSTSSSLLTYINNADNTCFLNLIAELINIRSVIYDEGVLRNVIRLLNDVEVKEQGARVDIAGIKVPVLAEDSEIVAGTAGVSGGPKYILKRNEYDIIQLMYQTGGLYENLIGGGVDDEMAGGGSQSAKHKATSSPAGFLNTIGYDFKAGTVLKSLLGAKESLKSDAFAQVYLDQFYENMVSKKSSSLHKKDKHEPYKKFMNTYQAVTVILSKLDSIDQYLAEYIRFGSMFLFEFLSLFSNTEFSFLLLEEASESFIFYNTKSTSAKKHRGYTAHKLVFFLNAITQLIAKDIHNIGLFGAMAFMPDILFELDEKQLLEDMDMFLNTNSKYSHYYNPTAYESLSDGVRKLYIKQIKELLHVVDDDLTKLVKHTAGMSDTAYFSYLEKHLPYGYVSKCVRRANNLVANVFMMPLDTTTNIYKTVNRASVTKKNLKKRSRSGSANRAMSRSNNRRSTTHRNNMVLRTPEGRMLLGF